MQNCLRSRNRSKKSRHCLRFLIIFGTRPEAIKLAPVIEALRDIGEVVVCVTGQHREMLKQVLDFFSITPDYDLRVMVRNQSLLDVTARSLRRLEKVIDETSPNVILVQGDTTTAFVGALAGFYRGARVAHVEAGLRSFNKHSPYPEEMNRVFTGRIADYHFAPTKKARENLLKEGISKKNIFTVGNTVIDALLAGLRIVSGNDGEYAGFFRFVDFSKKVLLVTGHRRESLGRPFEDICRAFKEIAHDDVEIVYPVHLNPNVRHQVHSILKGTPNVHLIKPLAYPYLIWLMSKCYLVLTDSGGIQEEAPTLGKPVLVLRDVTERTEGIEAGTALLVGTDRKKIVEATRLLYDRAAYEKMAKAKNPYGDGKAAQRIRDILMKLPPYP